MFICDRCNCSYSRSCESSCVWRKMWSLFVWSERARRRLLHLLVVCTCLRRMRSGAICRHDRQVIAFCVPPATCLSFLCRWFPKVVALVVNVFEKHLLFTMLSLLVVFMSVAESNIFISFDELELDLEGCCCYLLICSMLCHFQCCWELCVAL